MLNRIDLSRIDLNLLVVFSVVLEVHNVGRAADSGMAAAVVTTARLVIAAGEPL